MEMAAFTSYSMLAAIVLVFVSAPAVLGHGRLWEPPSRSSMWRRGYGTPVNYQDMELFCGGVGVQYGQNDGKCGICGDPWNGPRENEAGGKYANGIIVRKYQMGQVINVTIQLTANHRGKFEFHLCPTDNPFDKVTDDCLKKFPLKIMESGDTQYPVPESGSYRGNNIYLHVRLPNNIKCRACLFQWKYTAGNSWGTNPDGTGCIGCGNQEQFYGCADIAIGYGDVDLGKTPTKHQWMFEGSESEWQYGVFVYEKPTSGNSAVPFHRQSQINSVFIALLFTVVSTILPLTSRL